jgi:hypothetical protein
MNPRQLPGFGDVLRRPRDDEPRLRLAAQMRTQDPVRARFIEQSIEETRLRADFIRQGMPDSERLSELYCQNAELLKVNGDRWGADDQSVGGLWTRGFLSGVRLMAVPLREAVAALDEWPILHVSAHGPAPLMPEPVQRAIPRMVSVMLLHHDDVMVEAFLETYDLSTLRKLSVYGTITERSLHAICQAHLPMLEHLLVEGPGLENPSETGESSDWTALVSFAKRNKLGEALEARYGWKKYLHAVSRFSIWPYTRDVLEILPSLPDDLLVRDRLWSL